MSVLDPQTLVERALAASTSTDCVVMVRDTTSANLRWANNTLTTNGVMHRVHVTVVALTEVDGGRGVGSVSGTATDTPGVLDLVAAADAAARAAAPAEDERPLVGATDAAPDWHLAPEPTDVHVYDDLAPGLGEAFSRARAGGRILYGFVNHEVTTLYLGSSSGLRLRHVQPTGHYGCTGKDAALTTSCWVGGATRDFTDVDAAALDAEIERRIGWGARRLDLPAGRYDTILPPSAVADLMIDAYWAAGARDAADGQSVYSRSGVGTRVGEQIARPGVGLWSDPAHPLLGCQPFATAATSGPSSSVFDNGLPLERTDWIADGVLERLITTRHSADLLGLPVGPAVDNLVLEVAGATGGIEDLVAGVEDGLLLTCLWYIREVDRQQLLLTGLTRDGVYVVRDGEIVGMANNFRFNERPLELLQRFSHASATVPSFSREWGDDYFSRTATPALRIPDFHMSTVSQAL
ncbi:metallopeptidase TldD-related protein [Nocardioides sp.]|uniref:metallopeptidase TldD-related protein n=1 Tax=Nocardioides sp. TaxID=35761 RepID=UPI003513C662